MDGSIRERNRQNIRNNIGGHSECSVGHKLSYKTQTFLQEQKKQINYFQKYVPEMHLFVYISKYVGIQLLSNSTDQAIRM